MKKRIAHLLLPELVPAPLWGRSAYRMLGGRVAWTKRIRPDALAKSGNRCDICGSAEGRLICHDKWQYDDKVATATLVGFEIHCTNCDAVTHIGLAANLGNREEVVMSAVAHLCKVNRCSEDEAVEILFAAMDLWNKRSQKKWKIKVAPPLVKTYPELAELPNFMPTPIVK